MDVENGDPDAMGDRCAVAVDGYIPDFCVKGCGYPAAYGKDRAGRVLTTCCRACALGNGHDPHCPGACEQLPTCVPAASAAPTPLVMGATTAGAATRGERTRATEDARGYCRNGCGRMVAPGRDKHGRPFRTCCQACSVSGAHDRFCGLSEEEARRQRRWRPRPLRMNYMSVSDPLWGDIEFKHIVEGEKVSASQKCAYYGFVICPSVMATAGLCKKQLQSEIPKETVRRAWVRLLLSGSMTLSILQVVTLVTMIFMNGGHAPRSQNPMIGPSVYAFDEAGAKNAGRILYWKEWWRLFTPMMLHGGWLHIIGNLAMQLRTGVVLECAWGTPAWLTIYVISGAYGNLASCIAMPNTLGVGSSGALCGLVGAWLPFILITWNQTLPRDRKFRNTQLTLVIVSVLVLIPTSFIPMVDWAAHLGGLLCGAFVSMIIFGNRLQTQSWAIGTRVAGVVGFVVLVSFSTWWFLSKVEPIEALLRICDQKKDCPRSTKQP